MTATSVVRRRPAMATWFEVRLEGDDPEHLDAVAAAGLDEVARVESLLSRFDPRSEVARVNREAAARAVRVDREVFAVLLACRSGWRETGGAFDPAAGSAGTFAGVCLDETNRTVRFEEPGLSIDLGGFGKGYALDRASEIVAAHGVTSALLHGGTSSVVAIGPGPGGDESGWTVAVRDPFAADSETPAGLMRLRHQSLSCSSTFGPGRDESDVINPRTRRPVREAAACVVLAGTAARAEVLSTGLLAAGRTGAGELAGRLRDGEAVVWVAPPSRDDRRGWEWLKGGPA